MSEGDGSSWHGGPQLAQVSRSRGSIEHARDQDRPRVGEAEQSGRGIASLEP